MVLPLMALMACVMSLMFTLFAASGLVVGGKDSDIVLALPVPAFTVMLSKIWRCTWKILCSAGCGCCPQAAYLVYAGRERGRLRVSDAAACRRIILPCCLPFWHCWGW